MYISSFITSQMHSILGPFNSIYLHPNLCAVVFMYFNSRERERETLPLTFLGPREGEQIEAHIQTV